MILAIVGTLNIESLKHGCDRYQTYDFLLCARSYLQYDRTVPAENFGHGLAGHTRGRSVEAPGMARPAAPPLPLLLLLLWATLGSAGQCTVGRQSNVVCPLNQSTVEYELRWSHSWQWFSVQAGDAAAVSVGLVVQRGESLQFPRTGFVAMAAYGDDPPGSTGTSNVYDPATWQWNPDPVGPRYKYISETPLTGTRPTTDWKVITLGIDPGAPRDEPERVHVPLGQVHIGIRCQETTWTSSNYPGCRMSLTATLLPFNASNNLTVTAPMAPGDVHVYRADIGDYDTINVSISRDVYNTSRESPHSGLLGAAMVAQREQWPRPMPISFPFNLSRAPPGVVLESYPNETAAMQDYALALMDDNDGLLNLAGCADSHVGCREPYVPVGASEAAKQDLLRAHLFALSVPEEARGYGGLDDDMLATHLGSVCVSTSNEGNHYITLYADASASGDGRLSASTDGRSSTDGSGDPIEGVDSFGWWRDTHDFGCFCVDNEGVAEECSVDTCGSLSTQNMAPASRRVVMGYTMQVTHIAYTDGLLLGSTSLLGCVGYSQWRRYEIRTTGTEDAVITVTLSAPVGGIYAVAGGSLPSLTSYDVRAEPPATQLTFAACIDTAVPTSWNFAVMLGDRETESVNETRFAMQVTSAPAATCIRCPAGTYSTGQTAAGQSSCIDCIAGHFCPEGSTLPLPCAAGTYSNSTGLAAAADCSVCPEGSACAAASTVPSSCAPGSFAATSGMSVCSLCLAGTYQDGSNLTSCLTCSPGHFCPEASSSPRACPGGTYSDSTGLEEESRCTPCPEGEYCPMGSVEPTLCPLGTYSSSFATGCTDCPAGSYQSDSTTSLHSAAECDDCTRGCKIARLLNSPNASPPLTLSGVCVRRLLPRSLNCTLELSGRHVLEQLPPNSCSGMLTMPGGIRLRRCLDHALGMRSGLLRRHIWHARLYSLPSRHISRREQPDELP